MDLTYHLLIANCARGHAWQWGLSDGPDLPDINYQASMGYRCDVEAIPEPVQNELNLDLNLGERVLRTCGHLQPGGQPAIAPVMGIDCRTATGACPVASLPAGTYTCVLEGKTTAGLAVHLTRNFSSNNRCVPCFVNFTFNQTGHTLLEAIQPPDWNDIRLVFSRHLG